MIKVDWKGDNTVLVITEKHSRKILIHYHNLHKIDSFGIEKEGLLNVVWRIKSIQNDSLIIIFTNMDLVISSRISKYNPDGLNDLLYKEKIS